MPPRDKDSGIYCHFTNTRGVCISKALHHPCAVCGAVGGPSHVRSHAALSLHWDPFCQHTNQLTHMNHGPKFTQMRQAFSLRINLLFLLLLLLLSLPLWLSWTHFVLNLDYKLLGPRYPRPNKRLGLTGLLDVIRTLRIMVGQVLLTSICNGIKMSNLTTKGFLDWLAIYRFRVQFAIE